MLQKEAEFVQNLFTNLGITHHYKYNEKTEYTEPLRTKIYEVACGATTPPTSLTCTPPRSSPSSPRTFPTSSSPRLASFSNVVYGSQRVMKTCATMGQAAGTATAYCTLHGEDPIKLSANPSAVWSIQQQLLRDDHFIIG